MKKIIHFGTLLFLMVALLANTALAKTGKITGTVVDKATNKPLPGVSVTVPGTELTAVTDSSGVYLLANVPVGSYILVASLEGFATLSFPEVEVKARKTTRINFALIAISPEKQEADRTEELPDLSELDLLKYDPGLPDLKTADGGAGTTDTESSIPGMIESDNFEPELFTTKELREKPDPDELERDLTKLKSKLSDDAEMPPSASGLRDEPALQAAAHDDNEELPYFLDFLNKYGGMEGALAGDFSERYIIRIVDGQNQPVLNQKFQVVTKNDKLIWEARTYANGENLFFPKIFAENTPEKLYVKIISDKGSFTQPLEQVHQNLNVIQLNQLRQLANLELDLVFILDTTGSMADEIQKLKDTIYSIYTRILNLPARPQIRFAMILYRDKGDEYVTRKYDFTGDIDKFQATLEQVTADGGGDTPEDLQSALQVALTELSWNDNAIRLNFVIADAPPHLDYGQAYDYFDAGRDANARAIKFYLVGASGLPINGEYIFRQLAALTYGQFIFLTYGETGESDGTDIGKVSHHTGTNYQSRNLDDLVVNIVTKELSYQLKPELVQLPTDTPESEKDHLTIRMDNLWQQICKQLDAVYQAQIAAVLLPLETDDNRLAALCAYLQDLSVEQLLKYQKVKLIERDKLEAIMKEQGLSISGMTEAVDYDKIGKLLNSDAIFAGKMHYLGIDRVLHLRAISVKTGQIVAAARIRI